MRRAILPLLLGLLLALSACTGTAAGPDPTPTASQVPTPTVSQIPTQEPTLTPTPVSAPVWGEQTGTCSYSAPDKPEVLLAEGSFTLPHIENAAGNAAYTAINDWYLALMEGLKSDVTASVGQAQDDYATAAALGLPFAGYSGEETFEVLYETDTQVSILRTHYGYSDSPYPTLLYLADRFDLQTGTPLHFADFFTDEAKAEELIRAEVVRRGAEQVDYDQNAVVSAFNRENFYPTAEGFLFFYQPQTLNPQAATKPEFLVPYALLEGLLKK